MKPCAICKTNPRRSLTRSYYISCEQAYQKKRYQRLKGVRANNYSPRRILNPVRANDDSPQQDQAADRLFYTLFASAIRENRGLNKKTRQKTVRRALELEQYRPDIERSAELAI